MEERTGKLLHSIVKEYIKTAQPVGSKLLVDKYKLDVSSATVRNEMALLEEEGYIHQPHTSAGRVPTEKGYQFYVDNFLAVKEPKDAVKDNLQQLLKKMAEDQQQLLKNFAKNLAESSGEMIFVGFNLYDSYYTGMANIFSQPEFAEQNLVYDISRVVDHLDEVMSRIFDLDLEKPRVMIGSQNPFGNMCSALVTEYHLNKDRGVFGLLGPMRMDYEANLGLVNYVRELINKI
jgi:heat-inducible transcriptional repressor